MGSEIRLPEISPITCTRISNPIEKCWANMKAKIRELIVYGPYFISQL